MLLLVKCINSSLKLRWSESRVLIGYPSRQDGRFCPLWLSCVCSASKSSLFLLEILYDWPSLFGQDSWILTLFCVFMGRDEKRGQCPASLHQASAAQWRAEGKRGKRGRGSQGTGSLDHAPALLIFSSRSIFCPRSPFWTEIGEYPAWSELTLG